MLLLLRASERALWAGAWIDGGARFVTGADDGTVRIWPADAGRVLALARRRG